MDSHVEEASKRQWNHSVQCFVENSSENFRTSHMPIPR